MRRGYLSLIAEINELRAMKRRLQAMLKRYEEHVGYPTEVSGETVYEELREVLNG